MTDLIDVASSDVDVKAEYNRGVDDGINYVIDDLLPQIACSKVVLNEDGSIDINSIIGMIIEVENKIGWKQWNHKDFIL